MKRPLSEPDVTTRQIYTQNIRAAGTVTTPVQDISKLQRVAIKVKSTLDQAVIVEVIGDFFNPMDNPTEIEDSEQSLPAGNVTPSTTEIGLDDDDWQPFLALRITTLVAPTVGTIQVWLAG